MPPGADAGGGAAVLEAPVRQAAPAVSAPPVAQPAARAAPVDSDDDMPSWVTEFSDDSAIAAPSSAPAYAPSAHAPSQPQSQPQGYGEEQQIVMPARAAPGPSRAPYAYVVTPVPELDWDGNWPAVAALLPLRGVAQQLAMQAELINCSTDGNAVVFNLRVPIETWRTPGNVEKLTTALAERFGRAVRVDTELGAVWYTASAEAQAFRAACLKAAEETVANDPFVNSLLRTFDAWVVPGSIVPPQPQAAA
jgi:DNA polymerase-3 subunit gamma/tau